MFLNSGPARFFGCGRGGHQNRHMHIGVGAGTLSHTASITIWIMIPLETTLSDGPQFAIIAHRLHLYLHVPAAAADAASSVCKNDSSSRSSRSYALRILLPLVLTSGVVGQPDVLHDFCVQTLTVETLLFTRAIVWVSSCSLCR